MLYEFTRCDGSAGDGPAADDKLPTPAAAEIHGCRLEITRGRTRFPLRPVQGTEFLIGSAADCDLQIAEAYPEFYALITPVDGCIRISPLAIDPPLHINDVHVDSSVATRLANGDQLVIGGIEMTVHIDELADSGLGVSGLSTQQLVDLLDQEMQEVEAYESRMRQGAAALLEQVQASVDAAPEEISAEEISAEEISAEEISAEEISPEEISPEEISPEEISPEEISAEEIVSGEVVAAVEAPVSDADMSPADVARALMSELSEVMQALDAFAADLDQRADRLHRREGDYQRAAEFLISAQRTLARQIETVSQMTEQQQVDRSAA